MKCEAYIDPETNTSLDGEALAVASKNPDAPRCGYELKAVWYRKVAANGNEEAKKALKRLRVESE